MTERLCPACGASMPEEHEVCLKCSAATSEPGGQGAGRAGAAPTATRLCAKCHSEYDARYDGCPHCADKRPSVRARKVAADSVSLASESMTTLSTGVKTAVVESTPAVRRRWRFGGLAIALAAVLVVALLAAPRLTNAYREYRARSEFNRQMEKWRDDYPSDGESSAGPFFLDDATWDTERITLDEYLAGGRDYWILWDLPDEKYDEIVESFRLADADPATRAYYYRVSRTAGFGWLSGQTISPSVSRAWS